MPSVARAFVALAVLVAFDVTTIAIALVLLPLPVVGRFFPPDAAPRGA